MDFRKGPIEGVVVTPIRKFVDERGWLAEFFRHDELAQDFHPAMGYVSVTLPSLPVGTVGGGTGIETQQECLQLLGVAGGGTPPGTNAKRLAEIIASGVLAGELSLLGALAAQHLARAHQQLGRG